MRRHLLAGVAAGLTVALQVCLTAGVANAQAISTTPPCSSSYNPYDYTASALSACGVKTFPISSTTDLAGGGETSNYDMGNGVVAHYTVPPAGFDPLTATPAQLQEYDLPAKPTDLDQLATWEQTMSKLRVAPAPGFMAELPDVHADVDSPNWSGHVITGSAGSFTSTGVDYWEPIYMGSACSTNSAVIWGGIGGYGATDPLGQDGTAYQVPGMSNHQAWYEVYPLVSIIPLPLVEGAGDYTGALTAWEASSSEYAGYVADGTTGALVPWSITVSPSYYSGDSADAIAERPTVGGTLTNLSNFGTMAWNASETNGVYFSAFPSGQRKLVDMVDSGGTLMAQPSVLGTNGSFTIDQRSCN